MINWFGLCFLPCGGCMPDNSRTGMILPAAGDPIREPFPRFDFSDMNVRLTPTISFLLVATILPALAIGVRNGGMDNPSFFRALDLGKPGLEAVRQAVEVSDWTAASARYLDYRRSLPTEGWAPRAPGRASDAQPLLRGTVKNWAAPAKAIQMRDPHNFDWQANPLSPSDPAYSREVQLATARTQFWGDLAAAYRETGEDKYALFWAENFTDFVEDNPVVIEAGPEDGVAWRALETGIRMSGSWPDAYLTFLNWPGLTPELHTRFAKSVYEHGLRLAFTAKNFPERGGNHIISEDAGLMAAGTLFPEFQPSAEWRRAALTRLSSELVRQVYPDGFQAELSPLYHAGVLEDFLLVRGYAALSGDPIPSDMDSRLLEMFRVLGFLQDGSGTVPALNDSPAFNARELARRGLEFFDDPLLRFTATGGKVAELPAPSKLLEWSGLAVMRDGWGPESVMGLFYAGPVPVGHWHQDKLQFLLWAHGRPLLVDPGKMSYDQSPLRRYSIGTESHNTLTVDGKWQFRDATEGRRRAESPAAMAWLGSGWLDFSSGQYDEGYWDCPYVAKAYRPFEKTGPVLKGVSHQRSVFFLKPVGFLILDFVSGTGSHRCDVRFNIDAEHLEVDPASRAVFAGFPGGVRLKILPVGRCLPEVATVRGQKDPPAGWVFEKSGPRPVFQLVQTQTSGLPQQFANWLEPSSGSNPAAVEVSRLDGENDHSAFSIRTKQEEWLVLAAPAGTLAPLRGESGGYAWEAEAEAVVVHGNGAGVSTAFYGISFEATPLAFRSQTPCALEIQGLPGGITITNAGIHPATLTMTRPEPGEIHIEPGRQIAIAATHGVPSPAPSTTPPSTPASPATPGGLWERLMSLFQ